MGKASRNPTKKPYKVRVAEKQQEIDDEQAEEDQLCWNLVIACLISVAVCFIGEYLHKRPYVVAQESVDLAQAAFAEGRWSDCIDHYTEVIDAGYALTSAWARRGVAKHERGDSHDALVDLTTALEIDRDARMPNSKHDGVMALNAYHRGSALNTRGRVYFDLSMYEESLADFEASMEEDRAGDEESETYYETRIGEHLLWIGRATYMVGDRKGGVALFKQGCQRYRSRACCGAEQELLSAIGTSDTPTGGSVAGDGHPNGSGREDLAGKTAHNLRRLGRMPSTLLASDTRATYMYEGSCALDVGSAGDACDPTFYGGCGRSQGTEEGQEALGGYPAFAVPPHGSDGCGKAADSCGRNDGRGERCCAPVDTGECGGGERSCCGEQLPQGSFSQQDSSNMRPP